MGDRRENLAEMVFLLEVLIFHWLICRSPEQYSGVLQYMVCMLSLSTGSALLGYGTKDNLLNLSSSSW
jgi:hypothetical protein